MKSFKEQGHFFEGKVSEQGSKLAEKDASSSGSLQHVVLHENDLANESVEIELFITHQMVDKDLLEGVRTALTLHKKTHCNVLRSMLRIMRIYRLIRRLFPPVSVNFVRVCKPKLIWFKCFRMTGWRVPKPLTLSVSIYLSPRRVLGVGSDWGLTIGKSLRTWGIDWIALSVKSISFSLSSSLFEKSYYPFGPMLMNIVSVQLYMSRFLWRM